jgi:hypothetical protein
MEYPYSAPVVLTDAIYVAYGGHTGTTTTAQRNAAFLITEMAATEDIGGFLLPTTFTGTHTPEYGRPLMLDYGYINSVDLVRFIDEQDAIYWSQAGTANYYVSIRGDGKRGIIDIAYLVAHCNCCSSGEFPYKVQVIYNSGLQSGTSYHPDVLLALTIYAEIAINEIIGYGNEAPGDIGVQEFTNQQYKESRVALLRTQFGTSARAQFATKLLTRLRKLRYVGMI